MSKQKKIDNIKIIEPMELTQAACAKKYNVNRQYISELVKKGKLVLNENNKIDVVLAESFFSLSQSKKKEESEKRVIQSTTASLSDDATMNQVLTYKYKIEAQTKEIELLKKKNQLLDKDMILQEISKIGNKLKEGLLAIPSRISSELAQESDSKTIYNRLNKEIRKTLDDIIIDLKKVEEIENEEK